MCQENIIQTLHPHQQPEQLIQDRMDSLHQATFYQSSFVQFWWACTSYSLTSLTGVVFSSGHDVLRVQTLYSRGMFESLLLFYYLKTFSPMFLWPLTSIMYFSPNCHSLDLFCFSRTFSVSKDGCAFLKYSNSPSGTNELASFKSPFWCSVRSSASSLDHIYIPKSTELQPCIWLISYLV